MKNFTMKQRTAISVIIICLSVCVQPLSAQERTQTQNYEWEKTSGILKSAKGWSYNQKLDEWVENKNFIYKEKKSGGSGYKYHSALWEAPNFNSLQFKTITLDGTEYYCLVHKENYGRYKYPNIRVDWEYYELTVYHVYTKEAYEKLLNLSEETYILERLCHITVPEYEKKSDSEIIKSIKNSIRQNHEPIVERFYIKKYKDMVRFLVPVSDFRKLDFDTNYFEVPVKDFNKLLIR